MGFSVNDAVNRLKISEQEAKNLDKYDEKDDGQIEQSVFAQAEMLLSEAKMAQRFGDNFKMFWDSVDNKSLAECLKDTLTKIFTTNASAKQNVSEEQLKSEKATQKIAQFLAEEGLELSEYMYSDGVFRVRINSAIFKSSNPDTIISQIKKFKDEKCTKTENGMYYYVDSEGDAVVLNPKAEKQDNKELLDIFLNITKSSKDDFLVYKQLIGKENLTSGENNFCKNYQSFLKNSASELNKYHLYVDENCNIIYKNELSI